MKSSVISTVVKNDLCVGCGACAATCPEQKLKMVFNRYGEYIPTSIQECSKGCGICLKVCPFFNGNNNEDGIGSALYSQIPGISFREETGYYLSCYVGYAPETRLQGSSGGIATWLLSTLLKKGVVDYVVAVVPNEDSDFLFKFAILDNPEHIMNSAGSVYYPVELSGVLQSIQNRPGKYAIVGLPCFIKAIRLAAQRNQKVKERIIVTLGLVCGQMKSKHYTEYISSLSGVYPPLQEVSYRGKSKEKPACNYYFSCKNKTGKTGKIFHDQGVGKVWINRWFTLNACNYCDDVYAECADVTLMDAWLPEYAADYQGTNFILVRSLLMKDIFNDKLHPDKIHIKPAPVEDLIKSQDGVIKYKKEYLAGRLFLNLQKKIPVPVKRVEPKNVWKDFFQQREGEIRDQMMVASRNGWVRANEGGTCNLEQFHTELLPFLEELRKRKIISKILNLPFDIVKSIQVRIRRDLRE